MKRDSIKVDGWEIDFLVGAPSDKPAGIHLQFIRRSNASPDATTMYKKFDTALKADNLTVRHTLVPQPDFQGFSLLIDLPPGVSLTATKEAIKIIAQQLATVRSKETTPARASL